MVDAQGTLYDGDQLLFAVVRSRLRQGPVAGVVGTLMTNLAFEHALAELEIPFVRAAVGDRYVMDMLRQKGWLYGGENSGTFSASTGTRPETALFPLCRCFPHCGEPAARCKSCWATCKLYPQKLINVALSKGFPWQDHPLIGSCTVRWRAR
jgi:phosphoglucosamine mutase